MVDPDRHRYIAPAGRTSAAAQGAQGEELKGLKGAPASTARAPRPKGPANRSGPHRRNAHRRRSAPSGSTSDPAQLRRRAAEVCLGAVLGQQGVDADLLRHPRAIPCGGAVVAAAELKRSGMAKVIGGPPGQARTGYMWTMVRGATRGVSPPGPAASGVFRGRCRPSYSGYNRLRRSDRPDGRGLLGPCPMKEMFDSNGSPIAKAGLERIARPRSRRRSGANRRRRGRRSAGSAPLVNACSPAGSRLVTKLTYIANQGCWCLYDGRVEIDSPSRIG